jgi:hypothetical protein
VEPHKTETSKATYELLSIEGIPISI